MIRPTINYMTCNIICKRSELSTLRLLIIGIVHARGGPHKESGTFFCHEYLAEGNMVRMSITGESVAYVLVSDTFTDMGLTCKIISVSMGGSCLNILGFEHLSGSHKHSNGTTLIPIHPNMRIFKSLTSSVSESISGMEIHPYNNKVMVKFIRLSKDQVTDP